MTELARYGVGGRNLRVFRTSADREAALLQQILAPALRSRNPDGARRRSRRWRTWPRSPPTSSTCCSSATCGRSHWCDAIPRRTSGTSPTSRSRGSSSRTSRRCCSIRRRFDAGRAPARAVGAAARRRPRGRRRGARLHPRRRRWRASSAPASCPRASRASCRRDTVSAEYLLEYGVDALERARRRAGRRLARARPRRPAGHRRHRARPGRARRAARERGRRAARSWSSSRSCTAATGSRASTSTPSSPTTRSERPVPITRRRRTLEAPPDEVWAVVADPHHLPRWWPRAARVEDVARRALDQGAGHRQGPQRARRLPDRGLGAAAAAPLGARSSRSRRSSACCVPSEVEIELAETAQGSGTEVTLELAQSCAAPRASAGSCSAARPSARSTRRSSRWSAPLSAMRPRAGGAGARPTPRRASCPHAAASLLSELGVDPAARRRRWRWRTCAWATRRCPKRVRDRLARVAARARRPARARSCTRPGSATPTSCACARATAPAAPDAVSCPATRPQVGAMLRACAERRRGRRAVRRRDERGRRGRAAAR